MPVLEEVRERERESSGVERERERESSGVERERERESNGVKRRGVKRRVERDELEVGVNYFTLILFY